MEKILLLLLDAANQGDSRVPKAMRVVAAANRDGCTDDYPIAHHYRDAVLTTILGGTTEMHKLAIGRELLGINALV